MAILQSCCCWRSIRKGSFACGIYTTVYFTVTAIMSSILLHEELLQFRSNGTAAPPSSFIDQDTLSPISMMFTVIFLCNSSVGILASLILLYGLYRDKRLLLIPWICAISLFVISDVAHCFYMFIEHALKVNPIVAILLTGDLFIITLNVYALLCVISQYQELKAADQSNRVPNIRYSAQPVSINFPSTRSACLDSRPSPTQSPTGTGPLTSTAAADEASPCTSTINNNRAPRKSVKFDHLHPAQNGAQPWTINIKSSPTEKGADTTPLIEPSADAVVAPNV